MPRNQNKNQMKPTEQDKADFNKARTRIFKLMSDQKWHTADKIIRVSQQREGLRRLRELRKRSDVAKIHVKRKCGEQRIFLYRMEMV